MRLTELFSGPTVGDFPGRDNNFNLIRFLAATLVIWTHAFGLLDHTAREPVFRTFGIGAGDVAVDIFFVLSGFLVSKSWAGKSLLQFAWARFTRIYPGLWVSIVISLLAVAVFFTDESPLTFLTSHSTAAYFLHNATMWPTVGARLDLPHAFHYPTDEFNVPLWTLPYELQMYGLLAAVGLTVGLRASIAASLTAVGIIGVALDALLGFHFMTTDWCRFLYCFFSGVSAYALRDHIPLRTWLAASLILAIAVTIVITPRYPFRQAALLLALPYLVLWAGLIPRGLINQWNRLGDYSYGMYIYGSPIQIALISTGTTTSTSANFLLAVPIALTMAIGSWHFVEKFALHRPVPRLLTFKFRRRALQSIE